MMGLEGAEEKVLRMFEGSAYEPLKYYSNNLASENKLVSTLSLFQKGLVSRTTDEKTNRAYFTISEKGFDYFNIINALHQYC